MRRSKICPKCGSADVVADAKVLDRSDSGEEELRIATYKKPDAMIFTGKQATAVRAWVCVSCGYTELYAVDPKTLTL